MTLRNQNLTFLKRSRIKMFPDSYSDTTTTDKDKSEVANLPRARRSERPKRPSTGWTEESQYLAHPLRSTKKKDGGSGAPSPECMDFAPPLISKWSNAQLDNYYIACGVDLVDTHSHKKACFNYIRN